MSEISGDRHRWLLYRVSFLQSPDQQFDTACDRTWTKEYVLHEIGRLDKAVYMFLQEAFQDFTPVRPIFWGHRVEHPCVQVGSGSLYETDSNCNLS